MNIRLFGTDGIRAHAGNFPLNAATVVAIGQAIGERLNGRLLVGQDTRISSPWILGLLKDGIRRTPASVDDAGVIPTPGVALLVKTGDYSGGIMISASHNPFEDNGIKVFSADGTKLNDTAETEIEKRVFELLSANSPDATTQRDVVPQATTISDTEFPGLYSRILESHFGTGQWLHGMRIVADCANGAMSRIAPALLERLGATVIVMHATPTGTNINAACGAVHMESLMAAMPHSGADFGVAFDGDGDRSLFVSSSGRRIDGDAVLLMIARKMKPAAVVGTSMTNFALELLLQKEGIPLVRVDVGDRFIFEEMRKGSGQLMLGGEPSGHIIFPDFGLSGDGLLTTLKLAKVLMETKSSLDELAHDWIPAPHILHGVRVEKKIPLNQLPAVQARITEAERALAGRGRIVVRYSGTEPLLRVMIESDNAEHNEQLMEALKKIISESMQKKQIQG